MGISIRYTVILPAMTIMGQQHVDIEERIANHVKSANAKRGRKCTSAQIIERDDWDYEIMEEVDYIIKTDLYMRERYYVKNYPCVNVYNPYRTYEDLQEQWAIKNKKYRSNPDNVRKIKEWEQTVVECGCGLSYTNSCAAPHKTSEAHKYYVEHGVAQERKLEKIECECGGHYEPNGKNRHERSKRNKRFIDDN